MKERDFKIYRGDDERGELVSYKCNVSEGMVVLDVIHRIQADQANDLACRWNCKAGKCGSCSVEINGKPRLACMTRMNELEEDKTVVITPLKSFPVIKDIVSDVSWNYEQNQKIKPFSPSKKDTEKDFVIGIAASGTTPYVLHALNACNENKISTGSITCNKGCPIAVASNFPIEVVVGPEFVRHGIIRFDQMHQTAKALEPDHAEVVGERETLQGPRPVPRDAAPP